MHDLDLSPLKIISNIILLILIRIAVPAHGKSNEVPAATLTAIATPNIPLDTGEELNFDELQVLLERDQLNKNKLEKKKILEKVSQYREQLEKERSLFPSREVFWSMLYHLWIARHSGLLQWNQPIADLGILNSFTNFLKSLGINYKKIEILLTFSLHPKHLSMPTPSKEYFFILSYPFLQRMDLTLQEINLLLLEELVRTDLKQPHQVIGMAMDLHPQGKQISSSYLKPIDQSQVSVSTKNKKADRKKSVSAAVVSEIIASALEVISEYAQKNSQDAKMHKEATLEVKKIIGARPDLLKTYRGILQKKQQLILKYHQDYGDYAKTGAAPGLQLEWLGF